MRRGTECPTASRVCDRSGTERERRTITCQVNREPMRLRVGVNLNEGRERLKEVVEFSEHESSHHRIGI